MGEKGANMKYEVGDKFIIEIECRSNINQGLYKVKGFNTLVFDDNGLDRLEQVRDRCDGCKYEHLMGGQEPCKSCCYNYTPKFEPKPEEIQVGDEVELWGEQGVVIKSGRFLTVLDREFDAHVWNPEACTRTGKTYPELVKALESLPKDGE